MYIRVYVLYMVGDGGIKLTHKVVNHICSDIRSIYSYILESMIGERTNESKYATHVSCMAKTSSYIYIKSIQTPIYYIFNV